MHNFIYVCVQVYGVFYATSFLDLYRSPSSVNTTSLTLTVTVASDEQYLFLVSHFVGILLSLLITIERADK